MLSIIVPTIRHERLIDLYGSIEQAIGDYSFELILVGPPIQDMRYYPDAKNVRYITSLASPNACQQIGLQLARGDWVTHFADDCRFHEGALAKCLDHLKHVSFNNRSGQFDDHVVLCTKYTEGNTTHHPDSYFKLWNAYPKARNIQQHWWIFNSAILWTPYMKELGGWDSRFHVPCVAHADLAARAQNDGAIVCMMDLDICHCGHMPDRTGDHGPIHDAQIDHDTGLYLEIWNSPQGINRKKIYLDNWLQADHVWNRYQ